MRQQVRQNTEVDTILALQFVVAWAGEALSQPARLGWWQSDLVDLDGGGHLLSRLAPRTHLWASLQCARRVATVADSKARQSLPDPERVCSLFFWGFEFDERLEARIRQWKMSQTSPAEALKLDLNWNRQQFQSYLEGLAPAPNCTGREILDPFPGKRSEAARTLARSLVPLGPEYSGPYYRVRPV